MRTESQERGTVMRIAVRVTVLAVVLLASLPAALADTPTIHFSEDITGEVLGPCVNGTYTVVSGTIEGVLHEGEAASGNQNFTLTLRPQRVVLEDEHGARYTLRGAIWVGGSFNDQTGDEVITAIHSLQVVGAGQGVVDTVRFFERFRNGELEVLEFSTCEF